MFCYRQNAEDCGLTRIDRLGNLLFSVAENEKLMPIWKVRLPDRRRTVGLGVGNSHVDRLVEGGAAHVGMIARDRTAVG